MLSPPTVRGITTAMSDNSVENPSAASAYLPDAAPYHNEGKTLASWVAMIGVTVGAVVAASGFIGPVWLIVVGAVVVVGSLIAGAVLRGLGHGQPKPSAREPRA